MNKGKLVLVTGGSRGIGKAICLELACKGCKVLFTYMSNEVAAAETEKALHEISDAGHKAYKCNMSDIKEVETFFKLIHKEHGKVEVLINNAGITGDAKLFILGKDQDWWQVFNNNLQGVLNTSRCVLPGMIAKKKGTIINIGSLSAQEGTPGSSAYSASKAAIIAFTKCLFREYGFQGINTYSVSPGFVETEMIKDMPEAYLKYRIVKTPLRRTGNPEEVANLVAYLADSPPALLGGQNIGIDGLQ